MWTPKRIVLLVLGFSLFSTGYFTYSYVLGGIDGLPPLPEGYEIQIEGIPVIPPRRTSTVEKRLGDAFGLECPELKRAIKLEIQRNNMVLAADEFHFDKGRLVLSPFSVAMFGKKAEGKDLEINTIRSKVAYLTFDRPIDSINPNEMGGRKIIGAELTDDIEIINNRRTVRRDDDLELFIKTGPLFYEEPKHLIYTYDWIHVIDRQSKPQPNDVVGMGMELELQVEPAPKPPPGRKPHDDTITGVKRITLQSNVDMHLYVDGRSGFMNQPPDKSAAAKPKPGEKDAAKADDSAEKAHLHIMTPGRFNYLFFKDYDMAHFEVTPGNSQIPGSPKPRDITVIRHNPKLGTTDQLICQVLDLKLLRKEKEAAGKDAKPAAAPANAGQQQDVDQNITIEWAHATAPDGNVTVTSDTENLHVTDVDDLLHEAKTKTTVLKGKGRLKAIKEGNRLYARELQIQEVKVPNSEKTYQQTVALGPGEIDICDKKTNKMVQHAYWNNRLLSTKDERTLTAKGDMQDLLILTGAARFEDKEHDQELQGETLKVWLIASGEKTVDKATPASNLGQSTGSRADHLEAIENVSARSRELNIHDSARLVVWFKDVPPDMLPRPADLDAAQVRPLPPPIDHLPPPPSGDVPQPLPNGPAKLPEAPRGQPVVEDGSKPNPAVVAPPKVEEPARPIDLSAHSIEAWVLRGDTKNTLDKLWCEALAPEKVHVHQAPAKEGEQPVDITGNTLNLLYHPDGDFLKVTGSKEDLARLQMDKVLILGPEVNIDQAANKVWVEGAGAMRMDSTTTLSGKPLDNAEPLTIMWYKSMFVQGRHAEFNIGIQAEQAQATMACNRLIVNFDKPISLREGNKGGESPKVQTLLCDQNARIQDKVYDADKPGRLMKDERLEATIISVEALDIDDEHAKEAAENKGQHAVRASGPGVLYLYLRGGTDPLAPAPDPKQAPKPAAPKPVAKPEDDQLKLTVVEFAGSMYANSKTNYASFRKNIRVINLPVADNTTTVDIDVTLAKLPEGAMYLSCHHLEVYTREEKGKKYQEMFAREQAVVQSNQFWGRAAVINFDEMKDQVIFDGGPGGKATLYKYTQQGSQPQVIRGDKIIYNRKDGSYTGIKIEKVEAN